MNSSLFLSWNLRGLGRKLKRAAVKKVIGRLKPGAIFIQESKKEIVDTVLISQICRRQSRYSFVFSPSAGASGGLISCWDDTFFSFKRSIIHSRYIVCIGTLLNLNLEVALVNIYAPNDCSERRCVWAELKDLVQQLSIPVLIGGDFNVIRKRSEKMGVHCNKKAMEEFDEFIEDLALIDLPLSGGDFTWCSNREDPVFCRLDRFLMSIDILLKWPNVIQKLVASSISDHKPVVLCNTFRRRESRIFRWFDYWAEEENYDNVIKEAAIKAEGKGIFEFLLHCKHESENWNRRRKAQNSENSQALENRMLMLEKRFQDNPGDIAVKNELKTYRAKL
ncbi:hypothetical protein HRI_000456000 [Hibiscus trionum]|uniref:Endonuclease/exonuclease/phosphatase domain-containing protein n=1 Tax=Hibiscus trionum TaxID=183268 RepID=A0A9W7GYH9_HIBTR|nr:hypothetical protein HRI_000456000 [Hibiscus trionum]